MKGAVLVPFLRTLTCFEIALHLCLLHPDIGVSGKLYVHYTTVLLPLCLFFNFLTRLKQRTQPQPPKKCSKSKKNLVCSIPWLYAISTLIHPPSSSRNFILHPVSNLSEKQFFHSCLTWIEFVLLKNPQLCWSYINDCETAALSSFCHVVSCLHSNSNHGIFLQLWKPFCDETQGRKLISKLLHGIIWNSYAHVNRIKHRINFLYSTKPEQDMVLCLEMVDANPTSCILLKFPYLSRTNFFSIRLLHKVGILGWYYEF